MPGKLIVTAEPGGSRIHLYGAGGKELMASPPIAEPRQKGAALRALTGMLGDHVTVIDETRTRPVLAAGQSMPASARVATGRRTGSRDRTTGRNRTG